MSPSAEELVCSQYKFLHDNDPKHKVDELNISWLENGSRH